MDNLAKSLGKFGIAVLAVWQLLLGTPAAEAQQKVVPESAVAIKQSFAPVVKKAAPTVVNVYVQHRVEQMVSPFGDDPVFGQLFGERFGVPRQRIENSLGSGVMVDPSGLVVTNNHVIQGSGEEEITVALSDGREFPAKVVLKDEHIDLAVLRLDAKGAQFPVIQFADSDSLEVGDLVLAIGDPFGVGQTVTSGIVSALARTQVGISDYQFFIQTDAAINPGNSGGALVDMDGRLVGINTAIFSRTGGSLGIGFAIPSNMVRLVVRSALKGGETVQRPWLAATLQQVTPDIAESLGLPTPSGALVAKVAAKGPAAKAGLIAGDVVVGVDDKEVKDPQAFEYRFVTKGVGGTAELTFMRKGQRLKTTIALLPPVEDPPRDTRELTGRNPLSGCKVANLSPAVAQELGIDDDTRRGVVITDVKDKTPAARLGMKPGDIVIGLNDQKVSSTAELAAALDLSGDDWRLSLERNGKLFNISISG